MSLNLPLVLFAASELPASEKLGSAEAKAVWASGCAWLFVEDGQLVGEMWHQADASEDCIGQLHSKEAEVLVLRTSSRSFAMQMVVQQWPQVTLKKWLTAQFRRLRNNLQQ